MRAHTCMCMMHIQHTACIMQHTVYCTYMAQRTAHNIEHTAYIIQHTSYIIQHTLYIHRGTRVQGTRFFSAVYRSAQKCVTSALTKIALLKT